MMDRLSAQRWMPLALLMPLLLVLSGCGRNLVDHLNSGIGGVVSLVVIVIALVALFDLLGSQRSPGGKIIWALIIIFMPLLGALLYFVIGR